MKYFLKNIAQNSLPRTIIFIVLGMAMWIPTLLSGNGVVMVVATMVLVATNAIVMSRMFCRLGVTNLPSVFVMTTYWVTMSSIPVLHACWQAQVVAMGVMVAYNVLLQTTYQTPPVEQAFVSTLTICGVSLLLPEAIWLIVLIWGFFIFRRVITWRVWVASMLAIAAFALYMAVAYFLGWTEVPWADMWNMAHWPIWMAIGMSVVVTLINLLPLQWATMASGVIYLLGVIGAVTYGTWSQIMRILEIL